jgi:hypothetical protein
MRVVVEILSVLRGATVGRDGGKVRMDGEEKTREREGGRAMHI